MEEIGVQIWAWVVEVWENFFIALDRPIAETPLINLLLGIGFIVWAISASLAKRIGFLLFEVRLELMSIVDAIESKDVER